MKKLILAFSVLLLLASCAEDDSIPQSGEFPLGAWTVSNYLGNTLTLERKTSLPPDTYGFIFRKNGNLVNRANAGWCGTPPITTSDFNGNWSISNQIINVELRTWSGRSMQGWKVLSANQQTVQVEIVSDEYIND